METPRELELQLRDDLRSLGPRLDEGRLVEELYRALTRNRWSRFDREGEVALSFGRAATLLAGLREERGQDPLDLEQTGDEGELSDRAAETARELGWSIEPLDTTAHAESHLGAPAGEPRAAPQDTLAEGHREADERPPVPRQGTPGR